MIPNNNFSVLPWYSSIEQQNARKWWAYGRVYPLFTPKGYLLPFQIIRSHRDNVVTSFNLYTKDGELVGDYTQALNESGLAIKSFTDFDVILYGKQFQIFLNAQEGQYYCSLSDGVETWYSEVFTIVSEMSRYLKIEWWDKEDFVMDDGIIVYKFTMGQFKNTLYLCADIAKPEYIFEEEGETRDGYFFPIKQISEKRYKFSFVASEYLLDVMRFIRMADYAFIEQNGERYPLDTFLITPNWEGDGDIASVEAEFDTATVAKKLGKGIITLGGPDFNNDFNNDFNIE